MAECEVEGCSKSGELSYECNYCKSKHCAEHRLPEKHNCIWLTVVNTLGPDFRNRDIEGLSQQVQQSDDDEMVEVVHSAKFLAEETEEKDVSQCVECGDYTTAENERCLRCRRKEELITTSSPDVALDGSIKRNDGQNDQDKSDRDKDGKRGLFGRIANILRLNR